MLKRKLGLLLFLILVNIALGLVGFPLLTRATLIIPSLHCMLLLKVVRLRTRWRVKEYIYIPYRPARWPHPSVEVILPFYMLLLVLKKTVFITLKLVALGA